MDDLTADISINGCIDLCGYLEGASGWLFVGWLSRPSMDSGPLRVTAQFTRGTVAADAVTMFYERADVHSFGVGAIVFAMADNAVDGTLESFQLETGSAAHAIPLSKSINRIRSERIQNFLSDFVARSKPIGNNAQMLSIIRQGVQPESPTADYRVDETAPDELPRAS